MDNKIPASVSDVILHQKNTDLTEKVVLPVTRYGNIMNAPRVIKNITSTKGAPFVLLETGEEYISTKQLRKLLGGIY